jgi:uncharacterized protein (TIGR02246 family)
MDADERADLRHENQEVVMFSNDSNDTLKRLGSRTFWKRTLSVSGAVVAILVSWQATAWAIGMLRVWALATGAAMFMPGMLAAQTAPGSRAPQSQMSAEIVKAADSYAKAMVAGNAGALAALFTEDGHYLPPHQPTAKGQAAIQNGFETFFKGPVKMTEFALSHTDTTIQGDLAYDVGRSEWRLRLPDGKTVSDSGKYIAILRRVQAEWKLAYLRYNSDTPAMPCPSNQ